MKQIFVSAILFLSFFITACKCNSGNKQANNDKQTNIDGAANNIPGKLRYTTFEEFRDGMGQVASLIRTSKITACLDTLPDGYPDTLGRKTPLKQISEPIWNKTFGNEEQVRSAVYNIYHFDGTRNSLISYLIESQVVGEISAQTLVFILAYIPLPSLAVNNFTPPADPDTTKGSQKDCDQCHPDIKIRLTWAYKTPDGSYEKNISGYTANNTITGIQSGRVYRFDAELTGCDVPGFWNLTEDTPANANFGIATPGKNSIILFPQSPGVYKLNFSYEVCGKRQQKTFIINAN